MPLDVLAQHFGRAVAPASLLAERHHHDAIEVTLKHAV